MVPLLHLLVLCIGLGLPHAQAAMHSVLVRVDLHDEAAVDNAAALQPRFSAFIRASSAAMPAQQQLIHSVKQLGGKGCLRYSAVRVVMAGMAPLIKCLAFYMLCVS